MSKWHTAEIQKGELGKLSKIQEELDEARDAEAQGQTLMLLFELSDIIGACGLVAQRHGMSLDDLVKFSKLRSEVAKAKQ
jgi:phosphoribosyl-ATP pyrophosphohydrolase